jgi:hypothetical protein
MLTPYAGLSSSSADDGGTYVFHPFGEHYLCHTAALIFLVTTDRLEFWPCLLRIFSKSFKICLRGRTYDIDVRPLQGPYNLVSSFFLIMQPDSVLTSATADIF